MRFVVVQRPLIQSIDYHGDDAVTLPEILERFKPRKLQLRAQTLYDEEELGLTGVTVQELLAERGTPEHHCLPLGGADSALNRADLLPE